jgi:hypothetical protein
VLGEGILAHEGCRGSDTSRQMLLPVRSQRGNQTLILSGVPRASPLSERLTCSGSRRRHALDLKTRNATPLRLGARCHQPDKRSRARLTSHQSLLTSHVLFTSVMFELVDDNGADNDAAFNNLLPVSGNVGQVEDVIQNADDESADDSTRYGADTTG